MRILVTGGAGYIGSHTVRLLIEAGHEITVVDSLESGHKQALHPQCDFVHGTTSDIQLLNSVFSAAHYDAIVHFAGYIEAGLSMIQPERFLSGNVSNTYSLLELAISHNIPRFLFSSSAAVYGNPQYTPIDELHPCQPTNPYGLTKLQVEHALSWLHSQRGLGVCCLRYFNASGCSEDLGEDHTPETHLVPLILQVASGERPHLCIHGSDYATPDGTCIRDYVHVLDLAKAHVLAVEALQPGEWRLYNLGGDQGHSVRDVIEKARQVTRHAIPCIDSPKRPGDSAILVANSSKIRHELGWDPLHSDLDWIVRSAWEWKKRFPAGYS